MELVEQRDDLFLEYLTLHNTLNRYEEALALILKHNFHPLGRRRGKGAGPVCIGPYGASEAACRIVATRKP